MEHTALECFICGQVAHPLILTFYERTISFQFTCSISIVLSKTEQGKSFAKKAETFHVPLARYNVSGSLPVRPMYNQCYICRMTKMGGTCTSPRENRPSKLTWLPNTCSRLTNS